MLSDSLDPDQDLQSGSKLFIWYDVCCNIRGDFIRGVGGGDYVLVVKFSGGGDYVLVVKFSGGGLCPSCKIHGGDFVHVYKNEQGGFCLGGDYVRIPCGTSTNGGSLQTAQMNFCSILDLEAGCLKSSMYVVSLRLTCVNPGRFAPNHCSQNSPRILKACKSMFCCLHAQQSSWTKGLYIVPIYVPTLGI